MPRIWNIQEEHLDEAEFLLEVWSRCADSPKYTLTKLAAGPEGRLMARIEGLLIGGEATFEGLLRPVLEEPDDDLFRTAAASFAVLAGWGIEACAEVLQALERTEAEEGLRGLALGLSLSQRDGLIPWLGHDLAGVRGPALLGRLLALLSHRVDVGVRLVDWLGSDEPEVRRAAARLARHTGTADALRHLATAIATATATDDGELRWAAIESGLIRDLPGAWALTCSEAFAATPGASRHAALAWVAMLGDAGAHGRLLQALHTPSAELLWAAGLAGRVEAVDLAMALLEDEALARPAGELVCTIAGLSNRGDDHWLDNGTVPVGDDPDEGLPEFEDDDLEAELAPLDAGALRLPNPESVRAWWAERRGQFDAGLRYSRGRPLDGEQLHRDLRELPTRLRHPRALELAARTAGGAQIETRALTRVQAVQLESVAGHFARLQCQRGRPLAC